MIAIPIVVCLCGFFIYLTVPAGKLEELGRIMFWVGLTVSLLAIIRIMAISDARKMISRFDYTSATPQTALAQDREPASHAAEFPGRL